MTLRFQRLLIILISLVLVSGALLLILTNSQKNIIFFYTPTELINSNKEINQNIRIGGFVKKKSIKKIENSNNNITFVFTDIEKFRTIIEDVILLEKSYDEINKIVQETVDKFGVSIINFMGDAFLLTCWDVDYVIKASIYIMKNG